MDNIEIITGERIQMTCDHYIGYINDFNYNPTIKSQSEKFINLGEEKKYVKINNKPKVFCYTHLIDSIDFHNILKKMENDFFLVLHNSDKAFERQNLDLFTIAPKLSHIFTQNMNVVDDRVTPIGIGVANSQWPHGKTNVIGNIGLANPKKREHSKTSKSVFFNFNISTNSRLRRDCYNKVVNYAPFIPSQSFDKYIENLATHMFAICPEGNGIDCHRLWECFNLKVVPICKKNLLFGAFHNMSYPIYLIDNWTDLTTDKDIDEKLYNFYSAVDWDKVYNLIKLSHISDIINMHVKKSLELSEKLKSISLETNPVCDPVFDVVICVGPSDTKIIDKMVEYTNRNVIGKRNIYIVAGEYLDKNIIPKGCVFVNEGTFVPKMSDLEQKFGKHKRNGWYLQQLLKLYAGKCISGIMDKYLVIDADTIFLKPTSFYDSYKNKCMYNYGTEYHPPYFSHMEKLHKSFVKNSNHSGICHHMIFENKYVDEMMSIVEKADDKFRQFYQIFIDNIDKTQHTGSGASEYEMYFNFVLKYHPNDIIVRKLNWVNIGKFANDTDFPNMDYVSVHWYLR